ncbi:MAG TPA: PEP/pyruvate-binding domain-containing protein [Deltaproteobacteria bacterium]|nr:PEP/pyruvate-binding domain-containing protein [Deltaproteobacteria bacterium]
MKRAFSPFSTGISGLDETLSGLRPGDNVVFQVDSIEDYAAFVHPFCIRANKEKRVLVYFRFARHEPLLPEGVEAQVFHLHPEQGFSNFVSDIFDVIEQVGLEAYYVFDCLSELAVDWYSDRMLGNFFMLTCPYLYIYETIAYFALLRNRNTAQAVDAIHTTAQVVMDVYRNRDTLYLQPLKVYKRNSETMYMLHAWEGDRFVPVRKSVVNAEILSSSPQRWLDFTFQRDVWSRMFMLAQDLLHRARRGKPRPRAEKYVLRRLLRMMVTRDERLLELAERCLELSDLIEIGKRMIGTGMIGGKSAGMVISRAVLSKASPHWKDILESHDSFYVGSHVFYTYLIRNGCWAAYRETRKPGMNGDSLREARHRMLNGTFPDDILEQFKEMLNYFGQTPIIVRSSSLLEDAYGNAFSGKYNSYFLANQGTPEERLEVFVEAVRKVYTSTMNKDALMYREHWNLLDKEEQMALLVQRVSGEDFGTFYYPHVAGVGFSFNPFAWSADIDPKSGFLRMVFGLGTRAVDRTDDDYTRIIALNAPQKRPESSYSEMRRHTQRRIDVLDLKQNQHIAQPFEDVVLNSDGLPIDLFASQDTEARQRAAEMGHEDAFTYYLSFDELLGRTTFVSTMRSMLETLDRAYEYPVDIEFTANFIDGSNYRINLLQCRPFQVKSPTGKAEVPEGIAEEHVVLYTESTVVGNSRVLPVDRIIYVVPEAYKDLSQQERYTLARMVGRIAHAGDPRKPMSIMIIGPGRWGTTTPSLGVPVSFADINTVSVLCELGVMHEGLVPEVSLGTHFFNDLVEMDMLYLAVHPERDRHVYNRAFLNSAPNRLSEVVPQAASWEHAIRVIDSGVNEKGLRVFLNADAIQQRAMCYLAEEEK